MKHFLTVASIISSFFCLAQNIFEVKAGEKFDQNEDNSGMVLKIIGEDDGFFYSINANPTDVTKDNFHITKYSITKINKNTLAEEKEQVVQGKARADYKSMKGFIYLQTLFSDNTIFVFWAKERDTKDMVDLMCETYSTDLVKLTPFQSVGTFNFRNFTMDSKFAKPFVFEKSQDKENPQFLVGAETMANTGQVSFSYYILTPKLQEIAKGNVALGFKRNSLRIVGYSGHYTFGADEKLYIKVDVPGAIISSSKGEKYNGIYSVITRIDYKNNNSTVKFKLHTENTVARGATLFSSKTGIDIYSSYYGMEGGLYVYKGIFHSTLGTNEAALGETQYIPIDLTGFWAGKDAEKNSLIKKEYQNRFNLSEFQHTNTDVNFEIDHFERINENEVVVICSKNTLETQLSETFDFERDEYIDKLDLALFRINLSTKEVLDKKVCFTRRRVDKWSDRDYYFRNGDNLSILTNSDFFQKTNVPAVEGHDIAEYANYNLATNELKIVGMAYVSHGLKNSSDALFPEFHRRGFLSRDNYIFSQSQVSSSKGTRVNARFFTVKPKF